MNKFGRDLQLQPMLHSLKEEMVSGLESNAYFSDLRNSLSSKIKEVEEKISEERKLSLYAQKHLIRITSSKTFTNKILLNKLVASIKEIDKDIAFLTNALQQLNDISAERWGLNYKYLQTLVVAPWECCTHLSLSENATNTPDLTLGAARSSSAAKELIAATAPGLCAYLYAREAFNQFYVRDFFIMFRQFMKVSDLAEFIIKRHTLASKKVTVNGIQSYEVQSQILYRTIDILLYWTTTFNDSDFKHNDPLKRKIKLFIKRTVHQWDNSDRVQKILDILVTGRSLSSDSLTLKEHAPGPKSPVHRHVHEVMDEISRQKFQDSKVKSRSLSNLGMRLKRASPGVCMSIRIPRNRKPAGGLSDNGLFGVDVKYLVQQFCLIEQEVYQNMDILYLLNTRKCGLTDLETSDNSQAPIGQFLRWCNRVTRWTILVILSALTTKIQSEMIQKFTLLAKKCAEERNFSTAMLIFSALCDEKICKLPAMEQVPLKSTFLLEELHVIREMLEGEAGWLSSGAALPLLPPLKVFLCHIQQLEIGSVVGGNGVIRWGKCREIAKKVHKIRDFQNNCYPYELNETLQQKIVNEIHTVAKSDEFNLKPNHKIFGPLNYSNRRIKINIDRIRALIA